LGSLTYVPAHGKNALVTVEATRDGMKYESLDGCTLAVASGSTLIMKGSLYNLGDQYGGVSKTGTGDLDIKGALNITGDSFVVTVAQGRLLLSSDFHSVASGKVSKDASLVCNNANTTLQTVYWTIDGNVAFGGDDFGTLTFTGITGRTAGLHVTFTENSHLQFNLGLDGETPISDVLIFMPMFYSTAGGYGQNVVYQSQLSFDGAVIDLNWNGPGELAEGTYHLMKFDTTYAVFDLLNDDIAISPAPAGYKYELDFRDDGISVIVSKTSGSEVPEPTSLALLGLGAMSLLVRRR